MAINEFSNSIASHDYRTAGHSTAVQADLPFFGSEAKPLAVDEELANSVISIETLKLTEQTLEG